MGNSLNGTAYNQRLFNPVIAAVYQGQNEFMSHPVTQGVINTMLFISTGGIEGLVSLGSGIARWAGISTVSNGRVFWSGGGNQVVESVARNYAVNNGLKTLEMTIQGRSLTALSKIAPYRFTKPLWRNASASFAKGANGTVHVFQNSGGIGAKSIWGTVEYPILQSQKTNIIYHIVP